MDVDLSDVLHAIENDELVPHFQPLVGLQNGRLAGFEVLARWHHPIFGPILPANFIELAEENRLIGRLMHQVFEKAFAAAPSFPAPLMLSVNVSPIQLGDALLTTDIFDLAQSGGFPLTRLTVEITETALHTDMKCARTVTAELQEMGCRLALDDFGTGYSSLAHLQSLPFSELKIDRSFVQEMTKTRESRKIVASIIGLGHSLGLLTVAEGVETEEQADMLLWLGCEQGQGWLYGRPCAVDLISEMIEAPPRPMSPRVTSPGESWASSTLEALPTQRLAQLQAIYEGAPVGLCFLDKNLRYVSVNQRLADMNGIPASAYIGKTVAELFPDLFPLFEEYLGRALAGESVSEVEVFVPVARNRDMDRTYQLSYYPALDETDEVIGISIAALDVTENKLLEEQVRERDDYQANMVEQTVASPWIMDSEGNNLNVSSHWVRATRVNKDLTRNLGWLEAVHPDDLEATMRSMKDALRTGDPINIEYRVQGLDGEWRWMRSQGSPRLGPDHEIIRWYGTVQDIDSKKRGEERITAGAALDSIFKDDVALTGFQIDLT